MRRFHLFFLLIVVVVSGCSKILYPEVEETSRNVLLEVFGHNRCVNCPFADDAADSLYVAYGGRVFVLEYHYMIESMPPQFRDTLSPQPETNNRWDWYGGGDAFPTTFINGSEKIVGADDNTYNTFSSLIDVILGKPAPVDIEMENNLYSTSGVLKVKLTWEDTTIENARLFCLIVEDSVVFLATGAIDTFFNHVVRGFYPDENGIPVNTLNTLVEIPYTLEQHWDTENLEMVVFIQNTETKEILQAQGLHL